MLSDSSFRQLRFEGRPPRRSGRATAAGPVTLGVPSAPPRREEPVLAEDERRLVEAALQSAGLEAMRYRTGPFRRRMPALLRALRAATPAAAAQSVAADAAVAARALDALLIGHTEPFRDPDAFDDLRTQVLPQLAAGRDGLRAWSVGCSGGVELLSAAVLLAERGVLAVSHLRGSDCRAAAIAAANSGAVERLLAALPGRFDDLKPWASRADFGAAVARIDWVVEDALAAKPPGLWDLVLCRNLAIYLDMQSSQRLWARLVAALAPGGVLVTGRAERPPATLPLERLAKCIYRREGGAD